MNEEIAKELWKQSLSNKMSIAIVGCGSVVGILLLIWKQEIPPFLAQLAPIWFFAIVQVVADLIEQVASFSHDINAESNFRRLLHSMNQEQISTLVCFLVQHSQRLTFLHNDSELKYLAQSKVLKRIGLTALALDPIEEALKKPVQGEEYEVVNGYWNAMLKEDIQKELLGMLTTIEKPLLNTLAKEQTHTSHRAVIFAMTAFALVGVLTGFSLANATLSASNAKALENAKREARLRAFEMLSELNSGTIQQNKLTNQVLEEAQRLNKQVAESLKRPGTESPVSENETKRPNDNAHDTTPPASPLGQ